MPNRITSKALTLFSLLALLCFSAASAAAQAKDFVSVDAARYSPVVAPNSIAAGFTFQVTVQTSLADDADPNTPGIQLPTSLGGISISINNRLAGLLVVTPNQINYVVPAETETDGPATVVVTDSQGAVLAQGSLNMATAMLGIFTANQAGNGAPAALSTPDGISYAPVGNPDGSSSVVPAGQYLVLFGTGIRGAQTDIKAFIGGVEAPVTYAGLQGGLLALYQVNIQVPVSLANQGLLELSLTDGTTTSNTTTIDLGGNPTAPAGAPVITAMSASQVTAGQVVTLTGSNFATSVSQASVRLGSVYGQIVATKATELTFIVPYGAASNRIAAGNAAGERLSTDPLNIVTSISGSVQAPDGSPLSGVGVSVVTANAYTTTDASGRFLLANVPAGINRVDLDASSLQYVSESFSLVVNASRDNEIGYPVTLLQDAGSSILLGAEKGLSGDEADPAAPKVVEHDGLVLTIPGKVTFPNGTSQGRIGLTRIPRDGRLQIALPAGVAPSVAALITPPGTLFGEKDGTALATLSFPNVDKLPAGTKLDLYAYDRKVTPSAFVKKGQAAVNTAADKIIAEGLIDVATVWFVGLPVDSNLLTKVTGRVLDSTDKPVSGARVFVRNRVAVTDVKGNFVISGVRANNGDDLNIEAAFFTPGGFPLKANKSVKAVVPGETVAGNLKFQAEPTLLLLIRPGEVKIRAGETTTMKVVLSKALSTDATINLAKADGVDLTITPAALKIEAGKTEGSFTVTGKNAGRAVIAATLAANIAEATTDQTRGAKAFVYVLANAPVLGNITPNSGAIGSAFVLTGSGFSSEAKYNQIIFIQGEHRVPVDSSKVKVISTPNGVTGLSGFVPGLKAGAADVVVIRYQEGAVSEASNKLTFTVTDTPAPVLSNITPKEGKPGTPFTLTGTGFNPEAKFNGVFFKQGDRVFPVDPATLKVAVAATTTAPAEGLAAMTLTGTVPRMPSGAAEVFVVIFKDDVLSAPSNKLAFNIPATAAPSLTSITPGEGEPGATFTIAGTGFIAEAGRTYLLFKQGDRQFPLEPKTLTVATDSIKGVVPSLAAGDYEVYVIVNQDNIAGVLSNKLAFKILAPAGPSVKAINPTEGAPGTAFTISGSGFAAEAGNNVVVFTQGTVKIVLDGSALKLSANGLQGVVPRLPAGDAEVTVFIKKNGLLSTSSAKLAFKVLAPPPPAAPVLTSITPTDGISGTSFTIKGTGFGLINAVLFKQGDKVVTLYPTSIKVTETSITGLVPELAAGEVEVWVVTRKDDVTSPESNHLKFTVKAKPVV